jgi:hypothetical protein
MKKMRQVVKKAGVLGLLSAVLLSVSAQGIILYEDDFSDGTHGFKGYGTFTVVDDITGGLGTAALRWTGNPSAPMYANFTETMLAAAGDWISLSYDIRFETTLQTLGMGLQDDTDTDYGDWWKAEYNGYTAQFNVTGGTDKVFENVLQKPFEDIGTSTAFTTNAGWNDTAVHNFKMTIARTETGLDTNVYWDGALLATQISLIPATYTYDTLGMRTGGGSVAHPLLIDNVMVTTNVPEPATLMLLGLGGFVLGHIRKKTA